MSKWKLSYSQLERDYQRVCLGAKEPKTILVSEYVFKAVNDLYKRIGHWPPLYHPDGGVWFNGAGIKIDDNIPDGEIHYLGGYPDLAVIKLEPEN